MDSYRLCHADTHIWIQQFISVSCEWLNRFMWNSTTRSCHDSTNNAHDGQYCFLSKLLNCWRRSTISYTSHVFWKRLHKHGTETKECIQCTRSPSFITKTFCDVFCFEFWSITQNITDGGIFSAVMTLKPITPSTLTHDTYFHIYIYIYLILERDIPD